MTSLLSVPRVEFREVSPERFTFRPARHTRPQCEVRTRTTHSSEPPDEEEEEEDDGDVPELPPPCGIVRRSRSEATLRGSESPGVRFSPLPAPLFRVSVSTSLGPNRRFAATRDSSNSLLRSASPPSRGSSAETVRAPWRDSGEAVNERFVAKRSSREPSPSKHVCCLDVGSDDAVSATRSVSELETPRSRSRSRSASRCRSVAVLTKDAAEAQDARVALQLHVARAQRELLDLQLHSERLKIALMERELRDKGIPLPASIPPLIKPPSSTSALLTLPASTPSQAAELPIINVPPKPCPLLTQSLNGFIRL